MVNARRKCDGSDFDSEQVEVDPKARCYGYNL
jgi:hypothetical protein